MMENKNHKNALFIINAGLLVILLSALPQIKNNLLMVLLGLVIACFGGYLLIRQKKS